MADEERHAGALVTWKDRKVLVTGGAGFLGSHLCKALADLGAVVVCADQQTDSPSLRVLGVSDRITRQRRNVVWPGNIRLSILAEKPSVVFHLAGAAHIHPAQAAPVAAIETNVMGTVQVLEACREYRDSGATLDAVIVSSSNHVYGSRPGYAFHEGNALDQGDIYGAAKGAQDLIARAYAKSYGLPVIALRHTNAYGPANPHAGHIVIATILSLLKGEAPVILSDGTPVKGYLYVDDLIAAYLAAAKLATGGMCAGALNVSPNGPISVLALVDMVIQASGLDLVPDVRGEDLTQTGYWEHLDSSLFRKWIGWKPGVSLAEGLRRTYEWFAEHKGMAWVSTSGERR